MSRERSKAKRFCEMNSHSVVLRRSATVFVPGHAMHYKFSFNLGDCETRTKNIKGNAGWERGRAEGKTRDRKETGKEAVPTDGWHCGAVA